MNTIIRSWHPSMQENAVLSAAAMREETTISAAAAVLKAGGLVVFPTETVYGLGALVSQPEALHKIYKIKGRDEKKPLSVLLEKASQISDVVHMQPAETMEGATLPQGSPAALVQRLAEAFWPGPLTLVLPKKETIPETVTAGMPTIGVRIPDHDFALKLLAACGEPVATTSANLSNAEAATSASEAIAVFNGKVDLIIDGGDCPVKVASTVAELAAGGRLRILRQGSITEEELQNVIKQP